MTHRSLSPAAARRFIRRFYRPDGCFRKIPVPFDISRAERMTSFMIRSGKDPPAQPRLTFCRLVGGLFLRRESRWLDECIPLALAAAAPECAEAAVPLFQITDARARRRNFEFLRMRSVLTLRAPSLFHFHTARRALIGRRSSCGELFIFGNGQKRHRRAGQGIASGSMSASSRSASGCWSLFEGCPPGHSAGTSLRRCVAEVMQPPSFTC